MARYDRDYGYRYDTEYRYPWTRRFRSRREEGFQSGPRQPRYGSRRFGYGRDYTTYDRAYLGYGVGRIPEEPGPGGYGREYGKTRWETDYGDPFRDRERGTPIRMTRGRWGGYGREYFGREHFGEPGYGYEEEYRPRRLRRF